MAGSPDSAVSQVANLAPGETYSRSVFIPITEAGGDRVSRTRQSLGKDLSPVVARARRRFDDRRNYTTHTVQSLTERGDGVIVTGVVMRLPDDESRPAVRALLDEFDL